MLVEEAVQIHRKLIQQDQIAFESNLIISLGVHGQVFAGIGDYASATNVLFEAIRKLEPQFMEFPQSFKALMSGLVQQYVKCSEFSQTEIDDSLLPFIRQRLSELEEGSGSTSAL